MEDRHLLAWGPIPDAINLDSAVQNYPTIRGQGAKIVFLDAGINQDHTAFTGRLWDGHDTDFISNGTGAVVHGWNFYSGPVGSDGYIIGNSSIEESYPADGGHGTQDASIAMANHYTYSGDSKEYEGVASGAEVITLKISHIGGSSADNINDTESGGVRKALDWVIAHRAALNIVAVNMSFGVDQNAYTSSTWGFNNQIATLASAGVFLATSAGNTGGTSYSQWPASDPNVVTVGGWKQSTGAMTTSTSRGNSGSTDNNQKPAGYVDILAPGVDVPYAGLGTTDYFNPANNEQTSIATPFVAGLGALLKQVNPALTTSSILTILKNTGASVSDSVTGLTYKRIDVKAAIDQAIAQLPIGQGGGTSDIEYDPSGNLHLAWYSNTAHTMFYAKRTGTTWSTPVVIDPGTAVTNSPASSDVGQYFTLALFTDASNNTTVGVAYNDATNGDLRYAKRNPSTGVWGVEAVDYANSVGLYPSLKYAASTGRPAISYYYQSSGNLKFAQLNASSAWEISTPYSPNDVGRYSRNAVDPNTGRWVVVFGDTTNHQGLYVRQTSTGWDTPSTMDNTVADEVAYTDLIFDGANRPGVSYYDTDAGDLKFGYGNTAGTSWVAGIVSATGVKGLYTNLRYAGVNGSGQSLWDIVYYDKTSTGAVNRAQGPSGSTTNGVWDGWSNSNLETDGGSNLSAAWKTGVLTIAYSKSDGSGLKIADH